MALDNDLIDKIGLHANSLGCLEEVLGILNKRCNIFGDKINLNERYEFIRKNDS